jgi:hypothetical protein
MKRKLLLLMIINGSIFGLFLLLSGPLTEPRYDGEYLVTSRGDPFAVIAFGAVVGILALIYLIPSYIAAFRNAPKFLGIFTVNLLAGWSIIGWVAALIWAFIDADKPQPQIYVAQAHTPIPPRIPNQLPSSSSIDK